MLQQSDWSIPYATIEGRLESLGFLIFCVRTPEIGVLAFFLFLGFSLCAMIIIVNIAKMNFDKSSFVQF